VFGEKTYSQFKKTNKLEYMTKLAPQKLCIKNEGYLKAYVGFKV